MIQLKNVSRSYPAKAEANSGGLIRALDDFSLLSLPANGSP